MNVQNGSGAMFDGIAKKYDRLNKITSLGFDHRWRKKAVKAMEIHDNALVLDLACGTADMSIEIITKTKTATVIGIDPSKQMITASISKLKKSKTISRINFTFGNGEDLPFKDNSFDAACIAFGIRNFSDRKKSLFEIARVLKPQAKLVILELTDPQIPFLKIPAKFYMQTLVPKIGAFFSSTPEYKYLPKSIKAFPSPANFTKELETSKFNVLKVKSLCLGVCHLFAITPKKETPAITGKTV